MTHVIFDRCIRDGACVEVCPVECIVPGLPAAEWPWYYVDPDTCIDCGACVPECPVEAVLPEEDLPAEYQAAIALNARFFVEGPGYAALQFITQAPEGAPLPYGFNIDPTGLWLYTIDPKSGAIVQLAIDPTTGALSPTDLVTATPSPISLVFKA